MTLANLDVEKREEFSRLMKQFGEVVNAVEAATDGAAWDGVLVQCRGTLEAIAQLEAEIYELAPRQAQAWRLWRLGYRYREIAEAMVITVSTVKQHLNGVRQKMGQ
jgi:DNA-binding CsgD family transcriptional regulator